MDFKMIPPYNRLEMTQDNRILIIPGWLGSGPGHWQTVWEQQHPELQRVEQRDWSHPDRDEWVQTLQARIIGSERPAVLVAHSLGCLTVACWALRFPQETHRVRSALLVAPPDLDSRRGCLVSMRSFAPAPHGQLPFRSILVASEDDPYMELYVAHRLAHNWGSYFVNAGRVGHINTAAGFGPWPQGEDLLARLLQFEAVPLRAA
jgi:uncharacterized protein